MMFHNNILFSFSLYGNQILIGHMLFCFLSHMNGDLTHLPYLPISRMPLTSATVHLAINLIIFSDLYMKSKFMCTVLGPPVSFLLKLREMSFISHPTSKSTACISPVFLVFPVFLPLCQTKLLCQDAMHLCLTALILTFPNPLCSYYSKGDTNTEITYKTARTQKKGKWLPKALKVCQ